MRASHIISNYTSKEASLPWIALCDFKAKADLGATEAGDTWVGNGLAPGADSSMGISWLGDLEQIT